MAYTSSTAHAPFGAISIFRAVNGVMNLVHSVVAWKEERDTRKLLAGLTAEQLEDVGLTRSGRI